MGLDEGIDLSAIAHSKQKHGESGEKQQRTENDCVNINLP